MEPDREETNAEARPLGERGGVVVRATRHGALVLETENARRMMRRITTLRPVREARSGTRPPGALAAAPE